MKRTIKLFAVVALLASFTACDKNDDLTESEPRLVKLSSFEYDSYYPEGHAEHTVYTLTYGENDKLATIDMERYSFSYDEENEIYTSESELDRKIVTTFTWKEGLTVDFVRTDVAFNGDKQYDQGTRNGSYTFDEKGKALTCNYKWDRYTYKYTFGYEGNYLVNANCDGFKSSYTWEKEDLITLTDEYQTTNFTYSNDANPIIIGANPLFLNFLQNEGDDFSMGLLGRHPAHLPIKASYTSAWDDSETYERDYEYKKDGQGRLVEIKMTVPDYGEGAYLTYKLNY